jgi:hypothetical protein
MKRVDMSDVEVVHSGEAWDFPAPPCSRQMIRHLEMNEGLVTWVQARLAFLLRADVGPFAQGRHSARLAFLLAVFGAQG